MTFVIAAVRVVFPWSTCPTYGGEAKVYGSKISHTYRLCRCSCVAFCVKKLRHSLYVHLKNSKLDYWKGEKHVYLYRNCVTRSAKASRKCVGRHGRKLEHGKKAARRKTNKDIHRAETRLLDAALEAAH